MQLIFLDTETTGNDPATDRLCEVCFKAGEHSRCERFKPELPMSVKAMSITHITNKMLAGQPAFKGSDLYQELEALIKDDGVVVAHNAKFDVAMLEAEGLKVPRYICTLKVVKFLDQKGELPEYKLQYLRYFYDLEVDGGAHDAETDVKVLAAVYGVLEQKFKEQEHVEGDALIERMIEISKQPSLIRRFAFGKYFGNLVADVAKTDPGYLEWLLDQKLQSLDRDREEDWIYTLETVLQR